jgi:predicted RNA-binding Zn-ribbon protein involved in translation (DUF1610 family)
VRISETRLRRLRNEVHVAAVIRALELPIKDRDGWTRFLCPICGDFDTSIHPKENLGRCFRCKRNFNPIDLVVADQRCDFLAAVEFLEARISSPGATSTRSNPGPDRAKEAEKGRRP